MIPHRVYLFRRVLVGLALVVVATLATLGFLWLVTSAGPQCFTETMRGAA